MPVDPTTPATKRTVWIGLLIFLSSGCAAPVLYPSIPTPVPATPPIHQLHYGSDYPLYCPDRIELNWATRPDLNGRYDINSEGQIFLPTLGSIRVEGETPSSLASKLVDWINAPVDSISCRVVEYRSRMIYVYGPVKGPARAIPYQGPEWIGDFLRRAGGLAPGATLRHVYVVRPNVSTGQTPQVFTVDLHAILLKNDPHSNLILQPFDEVYIGQTGRSIIGKMLPEWIKPLARTTLGWIPGLKKVNLF